MKLASMILLAGCLMNGNLCARTGQFSLARACQGLPRIPGLAQYQNYLYVTAGNKLYCIGDQSGKFPKVGFHIPGQMGGIWQHPIKLSDGFSLRLLDPGDQQPYPSVCDSFITYPFASKFHDSVPGQDIGITRIQFVPDNLPVLVVEYSLKNNSFQDKFFDLELKTEINLMPVWLSERIGWNDRKDTLVSTDQSQSIVLFKDRGNPWYAGIGFDNKQFEFKGLKTATPAGNGLSGIFVLKCQIPAGKSFTFKIYLSGSMTGTGEIKRNITTAQTRLPILFKQKSDRYLAIERTAAINVPDKLLESAYRWGKYATDWLVRDVDGIGEGLSAGLPDYPWFFSNDQAAAFSALTGTIQPKLFFNSFSMLRHISDSVNHKSGRIIHEVSTNGVVYDAGRMEESQGYILSCWRIFRWTGNQEFLRRNYALAKQIWAWLQLHDTDHDGYIEGYGGNEIEGLNDEMMDVQVNTYGLLDIMSQIASVFNEREEAGHYAGLAAKMKEGINRDWWVGSEHRYADFMAPKGKTLQIIKDALNKRVHKGINDWATVKLNKLMTEIRDDKYPYKGYIVYYLPSGWQPMVVGIADTTRALEMLKHASFFTNRFGLYITGLERPDQIEADEPPSSKDSVFSYKGAIMPVGTAELAIGAARYGLPDTALMYIQKILNTFSYATPGTTYEISPDQGMFVQAWNISGLNIPLIHFFFGVQPDAYRKQITIHLQMPTSWNQASLQNLLIGATKISMEYRKTNKLINCTIRSTEPGWTIHFVTDPGTSSVVVNQKPQNLSGTVIKLTGRKNSIEYLQTN